MSTENPLISIIIPAYNVEPYLSGCLESVISQTYDIWELIIADDGSTDNTGDIADRYAALDNRVRVIHLKNSGVSSARNACLEHARGDYLMCLDADDCLEPDCLKVLLVQAQEHDADIVQCSSGLIDMNGSKISSIISKNAVYSGQDEIMNAYFVDALGEIRISVWAKLFKRIKFADIRFEPRLRIYEDSLYVYECCRKADIVCTLDSPMYLYRQHADSVMHSHLNEMYQDYFSVFKRQLCDYQDNTVFRRIIIRRKTETALWLMNIVILDKDYDQLWELRKEALNSSGEILVSSMPLSLKLKILGLSLMPHVYFWILKKRNSDSRNAVYNDLSKV